MVVCVVFCLFVCLVFKRGMPRAASRQGGLSERSERPCGEAGGKTSGGGSPVAPRSLLPLSPAAPASPRSPSPAANSADSCICVMDFPSLRPVFLFSSGPPPSLPVAASPSLHGRCPRDLFVSTSSESRLVFSKAAATN